MKCSPATSRSCWGRGSIGRLGRAKRSDALEPQPVAGLSGVRVLVMGDHHACALVDGDDNVWCCGENHLGQLGLGDLLASPEPRVLGLSYVRAAR